MGRKAETLLDDTGWKILDELQRDARLPYAELGRRVHLSTPAVAERVKRMEEAGIIRGYRVELDPEMLGLQLTAIVRLRANLQSYERALATLGAIPEVVEAHHVTGADDLVATVHVTSVGHLERVLDRLRPLGDHSTSIVLSTPIPKRPIRRLDPE